MAGVGKLDGLGAPDVVADSDAAFAEYAVVVITNPERAVLPDRQLLRDIGWQLVKTDVVNRSLQLSITALRGILVGSAMLFMSAPEGVVGVSGEHEFQALMPQFLEAQFVRMDNHSFRYRGDTSQLGLGNPFHLNDAEAAGPIGL